MQSDKNIPPDVQIERDAVTIRCGERETVATKDGIRIRERRKSYPALKRLVRLLSANFTNPETVLRLEYEGGGNTNAIHRKKVNGVKKMQSDKNIPPDVQIERDNVTIRCGERETVATKDGIRIRARSKIRPDSVPMDDSNKPLCV